MKFSKETKDKLKEIQALENKYGLIVFRAGLTHLFDMGFSNFDEESVEEGFNLIQEEEEADKANGTRSLITPEFKREILRCTVELKQFSIWTLFAYIKKYVVVDF